MANEEIAREFHVDESEADDLRQEAALALFKALDDFDPKSGAQVLDVCVEFCP